MVPHFPRPAPRHRIARPPAHLQGLVGFISSGMLANRALANRGLANRTLLTCALLAGVLLIVACGEGEPPALEVADLRYSQGELLGLTPERRVLLGEITALGLAIAEGRAAELVDPVVAREEQAWLARVLRAREVLDSAGVDDAVLQARYRTDPELELTIRHLIVLSERYQTDETREAARAKARRALDRIRAGEPFPDVAAEVSEEPGAEGREGLLEPGREGAWVDEFWSAAVALEPGEISNVVETQYGFHVLRLEAKDTVPFKEARPEVALEVAQLVGGRMDPEDLELPAPSVDRQAVSAVTGAAEAGQGTEATGTAEAGDATRGTGSEGPVVAEWEGGTLTAAEFRAALATLPRARWRAALADPSVAAEEASSAARLEMAAERMRQQGVEPPPAIAGEVRRDWEQQVQGWAAAFGFHEGMGREALRQAALEGLGARGQGPTLAREGLRERAALLHLRYPIRVPETPTPEDT